MTSTTITTDLGPCVALSDRLQHPQCPNDATDPRHLLCAEHLDAWHHATNARWAVTLHN
jgi:hypothetical protein